MALNKTGLISALIDVFTNQYKGDLSAEQQQEIEDLSNGISDAVDTYVKTASVTVNAGITVQVAPSTGSGATTSPGTGSLS